MKTYITNATLVATFFLASGLQAQELDPQFQDDGSTLADSMVGQQFPGFMAGRGGMTDRFSSSFNPAIGVSFDGLLQLNEEEGSEVDNFDFRTVELNLASRIDPLGWAYLVAAFEGSEFTLEEAVLVMDRLPANMSLRLGRMLADFGKWNTLHLHDKSYVFEDGVRSEFFGGNLNVTGLELHQWTGLGDLPLRWSLGVSSAFGAHAHDHGESGHEHGAFESGIIDGRDFSELGLHGRATVQQDWRKNGFLQYGFSFFHTSEGLVDEHDETGDGIIDERTALGQTTLALDFTLRDVDATDLTAQTFSTELWLNSREHVDETTELVEEHEAKGLWGFYQYDWSPYWGAGVMASWWQDAGIEQSADWFSASEAGAQRAVFVTHHLSEYNRLRLQYTESTLTSGESNWSIALQWEFILGSHSHPMDW